MLIDVCTVLQPETDRMLLSRLTALQKQTIPTEEGGNGWETWRARSNPEKQNGNLLNGERTVSLSPHLVLNLTTAGYPETE